MTLPPRPAFTPRVFRNSRLNSSAPIWTVAALALLALGKKLLPNRPVALVVLVLGIAAVPALGLAGLGVALLGEPFAWHTGVGAALVLGGLAFAATKPRNKPMSS